MLPVALALVASLCFGTGDFLGGSQTRRTSVWAVALFSYLAATIGMAVVVIVRGQGLSQGAVLPGLGAGLLLVVCVATFYRALAIGVMSVVGPIISLGTVVPVVFGLASGERPSALQLLGIVIGLSGVLLATRTKSAGEHHEATSRTSVVQAVVGALAWGFVMVLYAHGAQSDAYWTVFLSRVTAVTVFALAFIVTRPPLKMTPASVAPIVAIGVLTVSGNALYSVATTMGYLSIVSVSGSLSPVFVIVLAYVVLHERLSRMQGMGVAAAILGVALIASG